ncbi:MAG: leucine-rich repeat protein [Paludibacteraceae bacterium]|nr:leucine-rich repeat protein [Paludibacteraceae bacterium]
MKKTILFLIAFCLMISVSATTFQVGGFTYYVPNSAKPYEVALTSGTVSYTGDITIPSTVVYSGITYTVVMISGAFTYSTGLTSVSIPTTVTSIEGGSFSYCSGLKSITLPSKISFLGSEAFKGCTGLTSLTIPEGVSSIESSAFYGCTALTTVTIPSTVSSLGASAFYGCTGLTSVTLTNGVASINSSAFSNCTNLSSISIPSSVTTIGSDAFSSSGLSSITIPTSVTSIGASAFSNCRSLASVVIPSSVTVINSSLFNGCTGLSSVTIPSTVTTIADNAFYYCTNLTSIDIPASVTSIAQYGAFVNYGKLTSISVDASNPNYCSVDGVLFNKDKTTLLYFPSGKTGTYTIPSTVTTIANNAFTGNSNLTSVIIPTSVKSIEQYAFYSCTALSSIYANATTPVDLSSSSGVFSSVKTATCVLHVTTNNAKVLYATATQWKDFTSIVVDGTAALDEACTKAFKFTASNGKAIISSLPQGQTLAVYNLQGATIYNKKATTETVSVALPAHGVYIVKVGTESMKVVY